VWEKIKTRTFFRTSECSYNVYEKEDINLGNRDGAVVRARTSHQCGPGSIPSPGVLCGLSLLFVRGGSDLISIRLVAFLRNNENRVLKLRPYLPPGEGCDFVFFSRRHKGVTVIEANLSVSPREKSHKVQELRRN